MTTESLECEKWAVVNQINNQIGVQFALKLAVRKFNIIIITSYNEHAYTLIGLIKHAFKVKVYLLELEYTTSEHAISDFFATYLNTKRIVMLINICDYATSRLDFLVDHEKKLTKLDPEIAMSYFSAVTKPILSQMIHNNKGVIINLTTTMILGESGKYIFCPSARMFVHCFSAKLSNEVCSTGVKIGCIIPGPFPMFSVNCGKNACIPLLPEKVIANYLNDPEDRLMDLYLLAIRWRLKIRRMYFTFIRLVLPWWL